MADRRNEISNRFSLDRLFKFGSDNTINVRTKGIFVPPPPTTDEMITEDSILMTTEDETLMITE